MGSWLYPVVCTTMPGRVDGQEPTARGEIPERSDALASVDRRA
jgi:hypothetical protein